MSYKNIASALIASFQRDAPWTIGHYVAVHQPSGVTLWIANGLFFLHGHDDSKFPFDLRIDEKFRVWLAMKAYKRRAAARALSGNA